MTVELMPVDFVVDHDGRLRVTSDDAVRLFAQLGHGLQPGDTVHTLVPPQPRKPLKSSYGKLAHLRSELEDIDFAKIRREMTDELRAAGKI
jgi:hypothetical protein